MFLAPALLVHTALMIVPPCGTLRLGLYAEVDGASRWVGLDDFERLFGDPQWSGHLWSALLDNPYFFAFHMLLRDPVGVALAALLSLPGL